MAFKKKSKGHSYLIIDVHTSGSRLHQQADIQ